MAEAVYQPQFSSGVVTYFFIASHRPSRISCLFSLSTKSKYALRILVKSIEVVLCTFGEDSPLDFALLLIDLLSLQINLTSMRGKKTPRRSQAETHRTWGQGHLLQELGHGDLFSGLQNPVPATHGKNTKPPPPCAN